MRRWLEETTGRLGRSAAEFWSMTLAEYMALVKGWNRAQSGGVEPMNRDRLDALEAEYGRKSKTIRKK